MPILLLAVTKQLIRMPVGKPFNTSGDPLPDTVTALPNVLLSRIGWQINVYPVITGTAVGPPAGAAGAVKLQLTCAKPAVQANAPGIPGTPAITWKEPIAVALLNCALPTTSALTEQVPSRPVKVTKPVELILHTVCVVETNVAAMPDEPLVAIENGASDAR